MNKKRDIDIVFMRVLAAFFVVMIHASGTDNAVETAFNAAARFAVPLFVIISGRFMLSRERDINDIVKRCLRLAVILFAASAAYYVILSVIGNRPDLPFLTYLFTKPVHLWYLWCAIGLYMLTPILHVFSANAGRNLYRYALVTAFLLGSVIETLIRAHAVPMLSDVIEASKLPYSLGFIFCYMVGDYFERHKIKNSRRIGALLLVLGILSSAICAVLLMNTSKSELALSFFAPTNIAAAVGFYLFFRGVSLPPRVSGGLTLISEATLGIYLLHPMAISLLRPFFAGLIDMPAVRIPLFALATFTLTAILVIAVRFAIGAIYKKIRSRS